MKRSIFNLMHAIHHWLIALFLIVHIANPAYAQDTSPLTATVDRTTLSASETVTLTIQVTSSIVNPPMPALPVMDGFEVTGRSTSSQLSIINGNMTTSSTYIFRLQPVRTGNLEIGSVRAIINGQEYSTAPIKITVVEGPAQPTSEGVSPAPDQLTGQSYFIAAEVNNLTPYQGQEVVYTFRFYQAGELYDQPSYQPPSFTGFWNEKHPGQKQYRASTSNRVYQVTELNTSLFPTTNGRITIEPARLKIPAGFFQDGADLKTEPITLEVKPLPEGAPASFNGAVGRYTITATADKTVTKVNEPITLRVILSGQGNIANLPDPQWPSMDGWRAYDSKGSSNIQVVDGQTGGERTYERLLVPQTAGEFTIPSIDYAYFDPISAEYRSIASDPIAVTVSAAPAETQSALSGNGNSQHPIQVSGRDIRYIKPAPAQLGLARRPLTDHPLYWVGWFLPILLFVLVTIWQQRQIYLLENAAAVRSSQAKRRAQKALQSTRRNGANPFSAASQIMVSYLSDRLNQPVTGLTRRALGEILTKNGVGDSLIQRIQDILSVAETGCFSPGSLDPESGEKLLADVEAAITELEKVIDPVKKSAESR